jgi:hypothetical protein
MYFSSGISLESLLIILVMTAVGLQRPATVYYEHGFLPTWPWAWSTSQGLAFALWLPVCCCCLQNTAFFNRYRQNSFGNGYKLYRQSQTDIFKYKYIWFLFFYVLYALLGLSRLQQSTWVAWEPIDTVSTDKMKRVLELPLSRVFYWHTQADKRMRFWQPFVQFDRPCERHFQSCFI